MFLIECGHCPSSLNRWYVAAEEQIESSVKAHVHLHHPGSGQWVRDDDWAVLTEMDVLALSAYAGG